MSKFSQKQAGILNSADLRSFKGKLLYWFFFAILLIFAFFAIFPVIWLIFTSLKDTQEIYTNPDSLFPKDMSFATISMRIKNAVGELRWGNSIIATIFMSFGQWAFGILFCGLGGYALSKIRPRGSKLIFTAILWMMLMPSTVRTVPLFMTFIDFPIGHINFTNTYWPFFFMAAANCFDIMLFKTNFDSIPDALLEAASIDGCGYLRTFFSIVIPLSKPVLIYASIGLLSNAWGNFLFPYLLLTDPMLQTLPVKTYLMNVSNSLQMNAYIMGLIISAIPSFIIFFVCQKRILGGVNVGAVKG